MKSTTPTSFLGKIWQLVVQYTIMFALIVTVVTGIYIGLILYELVPSTPLIRQILGGIAASVSIVALIAMAQRSVKYQTVRSK